MTMKFFSRRVRNLEGKTVAVTLADYLSFWKQLTQEQQRILNQSVTVRTAKAGTIIHEGSEDCVGLILVITGRLRAYILSDEGKEITLYRLIDRDICLFSASCILQSIQFDIIVEAEQDTEFFHIPAAIYQKLMRESAAVSNYTNELMASRFSDVMWLMDQVLNKKLDSRLAAFLLEESGLTGSSELKITHEKIAHHLGSAREVVTRMLKYFADEGLVSLSRGGISIVDLSRLTRVASESLR